MIPPLSRFFLIDGVGHGTYAADIAQIRRLVDDSDSVGDRDLHDLRLLMLQLYEELVVADGTLDDELRGTWLDPSRAMDVVFDAARAPNVVQARNILRNLRLDDWEGYRRFGWKVTVVPMGGKFSPQLPGYSASGPEKVASVILGRDSRSTVSLPPNAPNVLAAAAELKSAVRSAYRTVRGTYGGTMRQELLTTLAGPPYNGRFTVRQARELWYRMQVARGQAPRTSTAVRGLATADTVIHALHGAVERESPGRGFGLDTVFRLMSGGTRRG